MSKERVALLVSLLVLQGFLEPVSASTLSRPGDPVVLKGAAVPGFASTAPGDVVAFRWDGTWVQIPVQVDEKDQVEFARVYGFYDQATNPTGSSQNAQGLFAEQYTDANTFTGPDSDPAVDDDDEVVFMAKDAGEQPTTFTEPAGIISGSGVEVRIDDPLDGGRGYVYLFERSGALDPSAGQQYVSYDFNLLSGDYKTTYDLDSGTAHGPQLNPEDSTITTAFYERHWAWRWTNDDLRIFAGSASGLDFLEKRDYWIAPGSCGRHNATFNAREGAFFANIVGPVRAIRSYMGSNSGPLTQSEHIYYEQREDMVSTARVHSRPATGIIYADYNTAAFGMIYSDNNNPAGVTIDGVPDTVTAGPLTWEMVTGPQGSKVTVGSYETDIAGYANGVTSYYQDETGTTTTICQECEEAPTAACPSIGTGSDGDLIGAHGFWGTDPLPNTDPRNPPFNNLLSRNVTYYGAPGFTSVDANQRRTWYDTPLDTTVTALNLAPGCSDTPRVGCRTAGRSILVYKDGTPDSKDKFVFKWTNGQATSQAEFADPGATAQYDLCIYGGPSTALFVEAGIPPNADTWSPIGSKGYKYVDRFGTVAGAQSIVLRGNDEDKAKMIWKGRGESLPDLPSVALPLNPNWFPLVVQISNSDTQICFEASFSAQHVATNLEDKLKLKKK